MPSSEARADFVSWERGSAAWTYSHPGFHGTGPSPSVLTGSKLVPLMWPERGRWVPSCPFYVSALDTHLRIQTKQDQLHNTLHKHRHPFVLRENKSCNGKSVDFGARHTWSESHFLVMQP